MKNLCLSREEFNQIMNSPPKRYTDYANVDKLWKRFRVIVNFARDRVIGER